MAIATIKASNRFYRVSTKTADLAGFPYIELGPGNTSSSVGGLMIELNPSELFAGDFVVMARPSGAASDTNDTPFVPIPYRVGSLNNVAQVVNGQGWPWSAANLSQSAIIWIPTNGLSIVFMDGLTAGTMDLTSWDLQGAPAL